MSRTGTQAPPSGVSRRQPPSRSSTRAPQSSVAGSRAAMTDRTITQHPALTDIFEDQSTVVPSTAPVFRDRHLSPDDPSLNNAITGLREYLQRTDLEHKFNDLCKLLLSRPNLPFNPYPGFVRRTRIQAERFHLYQESDSEVLQKVVSRLEPASGRQVTHPVNCNYVWGLRHLVAVVDPSELRRYQWLIRTITPSPTSLYREPGYSNQVMVALVGPSVFHGPLYSHPHTVSVRVEYLITGYSLTTGVNMFVKSIISDMRHMDTEGTHLALGISVPVQSEDDLDTWTRHHWTLTRVQHSQGRFEQAVVDAVSGKQLIYLECLFRTEDSADVFKRGEKQYSLNFIEIPDDRFGTEALHYFSEFPLVSLQEGVFMTQAQAEAYLAVFSSRLTGVDRGQTDELDDNQDIPIQVTAPVHSPQHSQAATAQDDLSQTGSGQGSPGSRGQSSPGQKPQAPVHRGKVKVDGFRFGDSAGLPFSWQITAPIRSYWQRQIARLQPQTDLLDVVHYALLLVLLDREGYDEKLLVEIYRILHSTAARLYALMMLNKTLRELVVRYEGHPVSAVGDSIFAQYRRGIEQLFHAELQERSCDLLTASRAICRRLQELTMTADDQSGGSLPLNIKTVEVLKEVNSYCRTVLLQLSEDALPCCPALSSFIVRLKEGFPEEAARVQTGIKLRQQQPNRAYNAIDVDELFEHGLEDETIMKHDSQVVDVQMCMERDTAPKSIGVEAVLLRYLTDTRLDEVWPNLLMELMSSGKIPANPYPKTVTTFRQYATRLDLCYEDTDVLSQRLLHRAARLEDATNFIYHIPGCDAHGHQSALAVLDIATFYQLSRHIKALRQKDYIERQGPYRVAVCGAVTGATVYYGKMDPYLRQIELSDHCYIRGPDGCGVEAIQIHSKMVYEHLLDLYKRDEHILMGIYMGTDQKRWSIFQIMKKKKGFASELDRTCKLRQPIYLKLYVHIGWRFVPVIKHFNLHFINDAETQHEQFCPENSYDLYQNVFFERERAAFHFQYGGAPKRADPARAGSVREVCGQLDQKILQFSQRQDWLSVYRLLLLRNIMYQGSSLIGEVWRMSHSAAGELEYVISLGRSLQDGVRYVMEYREAGKAPRKPAQQSADTEPEPSRLETMEAQLGHMMAGYRQKVEEVCQRQCCMAPRGLLELLQSKLREITEREEVTRQLYVVVSVKTIHTLDDISHMLYILQLMVSHDVHSVSPRCQASLRSIQAEYQPRPSSVASVRLSDPDVFQRRPVAQVTGYSDDWPNS